MRRLCSQFLLLWKQWDDQPRQAGAGLFYFMGIIVFLSASLAAFQLEINTEMKSQQREAQILIHQVTRTNIGNIVDCVATRANDACTGVPGGKGIPLGGNDRLYRSDNTAMTDDDFGGLDYTITCDPANPYNYDVQVQKGDPAIYGVNMHPLFDGGLDCSATRMMDRLKDPNYVKRCQTKQGVSDAAVPEYCHYTKDY